MIEYKWLPSEPSKEMKKYVSKYQSIVDYKQMWKDAPDVEQKPFGYVYQNGNNFVFSKHHFSDTKNTTLTPLYTTPQHEQESVKLTAVDDLMTRVSSTSPVLSLPDEVMSSEALFEFITNNPPPKSEPLSEDDISKLIYWVHRLYAEIPDKKENYDLFDEVNASGVLMIDHFYDRLPKESKYNEATTKARAIEKVHGIGV